MCWCWNTNRGFVMKLEVEDEIHLKQIAKAKDMAFAIFHLHFNFWNQFRGDDNVDKYIEAMNEVFEKYSIDADDLNE